MTLFICTSKVLSLPLPIGEKGTGGFESYTTSKIPNKYIYDTFLMIYLCILLLLLISLFGTSKRMDQNVAKHRIGIE